MSSGTANKIFSGLAAGFAATIPMTLAMVWIWKRLPREEQYALPPQEIVTVFADKADLPVPITSGQHLAATGLSHFGFGAVTGAVYALYEDRLDAPPVVKGMAFALLVWGTSYLIVWPTLNVLKSAVRHPARRNAMMIAAHLAWGATLGPLVATGKPQGR